ncbi:heavy-metal-associated domain-containing protein [Betaproteobacteria bacterium SCN2]|jgi:copper chaperone|nr:heavy-metal-associated domain-containing protein [Betaproteobacteria bacterium SCN2]
MTETILTISGMTCGGCVNSVTRVLTAVPGVQKADVTLLPSQARVSYDAALADPEKLAQAVADAGFTVTAHRPA